MNPRCICGSAGHPQCWRHVKKRDRRRCPLRTRRRGGMCSYCAPTRATHHVTADDDAPAYAFTCPTCKALIGARCRAPNGWAVRIHRLRVLKAVLSVEVRAEILADMEATGRARRAARKPPEAREWRGLADAMCAERRVKEARR